ncbi:MAG: FIST C-terminal domain-containing protein [Nitrospirales bacterium]|nr:FIST C-terminal domain-containing protein [Nitrospira sp.]MDR4500708.1 FIST C-terminal domain-containing protein [Nitrospirales bacterium]
MKCHVAISTETDLDRAIEALHDSTSRSLGDDRPHLAFLFFSSYFSEEAETLHARIQERIAPQVLLGCMNNGVIGGTEEFEEQPAIVLWSAVLPNVTIFPIRLVAHEGQGGVSLRGWPESFACEASRHDFFLFADPFSTPIDKMFSEIAQRCPGTLAIGGIASGGTDSGENRLILNQEIFDDGIVGVALSGKITLRTVVSQGCQPIGEPYVITKAHRNIIYELGGTSMLERLKAIMHEIRQAGDQSIARSIQVGLLMNEYMGKFGRGDFLIRDLMGADEKSGGVAISDVVREGQTLQFHLRDARAADEELKKLLQDFRQTHGESAAKGALLFSCYCRGKRLFPDAHHDITVLRNEMGDLPVAGFFAGGEIGPVGGQNYLHGYTASMALFCEAASHEH